MTTFLVIWSLVLLAASFAVNCLCLCVLLNSWHLYARGRGGRNPPETTGYFVYLFVVVANLMSLVLCKVPLVHQDWHHGAGGFLMGEAACQWTLAADLTLGLVQFVTVCAYLACVGLRLRRRLEETSFKEGICAVAASLVLSAAVGVVLTYRRDAGDDGERRRCGHNWRNSTWLTAFHWAVGHLGPLGLLAVPALVQLCASRRHLGGQLKSFLLLSAAVVGTHCLLNVPALVLEVQDRVVVVRSHSSWGGAATFVDHVLTSLLPELQYIYLPVGVLLLLPTTYTCCYREEDYDVPNGTGSRTGPVVQDSEESLIVTVDIQQRLSRSRTTVV